MQNLRANPQNVLFVLCAPTHRKYTNCAFVQPRPTFLALPFLALPALAAEAGFLPALLAALRGVLGFLPLAGVLAAGAAAAGACHRGRMCVLLV